MKRQPGWKAEYEGEIHHAHSARLERNEGMARVCARRAAGIVIGEYLSRQGYKRLNASAFDCLQLFNSLPEVDEALKAIASHFLLKVDHDHRLPVDVDLVKEAEILARILLLDNTN
ncbi:MAG: hypothetical protein ACM3H7_08570 [Acidobacteriaceae bacterium]